jgi:uncharacterized protein (TIGR02466 family)
MSGKFSFTFNLGGKGPVPLTGAPAHAAAPALQPHDLFATRIWQTHLDALTPHMERWVQAVLAMRAAHPEPAGRTVRQGWNSADMSVLEQPQFLPLRDAIRAACTAALREMGQGERAFYLQSWINLHDRGGFNYLHMHEGSLLSGSFYLQVPPGSGQFVFRDPRPGVLHGFVKGGVPNGHADVHLRPSAGLLVLFPCWMEHYVEPHDSDEPRITIAFNANPPDGEAATKR